MSKKFYFIFSILVFAILFSFIGCTDLLAPKAQTDISLKIDLSKIIKSSRNEGGSQGASSLGDNPTIKVAIYDAKDYDKATNSTENLTLITQAQASVGGDGIARVKLSDIPVGIDAIVFAELSFSNGTSTEVVYAGNSDVFKVKASDNKVRLVLKKVGNDSEPPIDDTGSGETYVVENFILYTKDNGGETEVDSNEYATLTNETEYTIVTVEKPDNSDSVWSYFVKPENNTRFTEDGNYKVSVELKTKSDATTVVGIAAARADYFFTVNDTWTLCEFKTGYVKGSTKHQFTIGLGLSSEIQIRNLKIEKLSEIDTSEPSLVFDISRHAIETYLDSENNSKNIIEVSKETKFENKLGYTITINAPLSHSESTSTATVQDVKLHLRSYATENTGANRVSFRVDNIGANTFYTSVMADTASYKSTAWNNGTNKIDSGRFDFYEIDFPNYVANDELIVDVITSSDKAITAPIKLHVSEFAVTVPDNTTPFANKFFAIKTGNTWEKIDDGAPFSKEVTISDSISFDVVLFNNTAWDEETNSLSINFNFNEATRFLYKGKNLPTELSYREEAGPKFTITNNSGSDKIVKISLNENYEVVIEEVTGTTITSWDNLKFQIEGLTNSNTATEFVIAENLEATKTITVSKPVKIIALKNVTISRGANFPGKFFVVSGTDNESDKGSLELGSNDYTITVDGGKDNNITATDPLIWAYSESGSLTLTNCILQNNTLHNTVSGFGNGGAVKVESNFTMNNSFIKNCSANVNGGAVYIFSRGSFTMNGGSITECSANDGGAVYITGGGTFTMNDDATISDCTANLSGGGVWMDGGSSFTMSGRANIKSCNALGNEGGGVFITSNGNPCSFTMNGSATITECSAEKDGGGVSYGCGTSADYNFTMQGNASISKCRATNNGGGVYLYGNLVMKGGTISGNEASNGAGVYVRDNSSSFTMENGSISDNKATVSGGGVYLLDSTSSFIMEGGIIGKEITEGTEVTKQSWEYAATGDKGKHSNYAGEGGGGIYAENGTVSIEGGKISYNYVPDPDGKGDNNGSSLSSGGGICMNKGTLTLENSEVSYNRGYLGAGVRCYAGNSKEGTVTLKKAIIKGNAGKHYGWNNFGSGLTVKNFELICDSSSDPSIIEENFSADGGAVFLEHTTSTLENIIIRNNSFNDNGYKYGSEMLLWDSAVISIASNTVNILNEPAADRKGIFINNSTDKLKLSGDISLESPIYLYFEDADSSPAVTVAGNLSEDTVATIKLVGDYATEGKLVLEAEGGVTLTEKIIDKFTLGNEKFVIDSDGKLAKINTELNLITELSSITANAYGVKQLPSGVYYLEENLELDAPVYISRGDVVIYAKNNATIRGNINNDCFFVVSDCSLTFGKDESTNATLTINAENKSDASAVLNAGSSGTLNLKNNVICTGATNQSFITTANGTVNIFGGKITENHGASPVINITGGTVNITGGEISNNSCVNMTGYCSGILVSRGTLNISGTTTTISNNQFGFYSDNLENKGASIYCTGGTVYLPDGSAVTSNGMFTKNIINGVIQEVATGGGNANYSIGDVYYQNDIAMGVVFEVGYDYIKIVALDDIKTSNGNYLYDGISPSSCINEETYPAAYDENDGVINSNAFIDFVNSLASYNFNTETDLAAFYMAWSYYVEDAENPSDSSTFTWYIPSINELQTIVDDEDGKISSGLTGADGVSIAVGYNYWSSTLVKIDGQDYSTKGYILPTLSKERTTYVVTTDAYFRLVKKINF